MSDGGGEQSGSASVASSWRVALKRVFVMPDDEKRAKEIVREIEEGAAPE